MAKKDFSKMTLEERATQAFEEQQGAMDNESDLAPEPKPLPPSISSAASNARAQAAVRQALGIDASGQKVGIAPPGVLSLFKGADYLNIILNGAVEGSRDTGAEPKNIKVRKNIMPEDLYDGSMDHRMFEWFIYFMHPAFGDEVLTRDGMTAGGQYIKRVVELATGYGVKPLSFLREAVWSLIRDGKMLKGADLGDLPNDRTRAHDDEDEAENVGLKALLEWSTFTALQNESRRHGCAPKHILTHGIKAAIDAGVFKP